MTDRKTIIYTASLVFGPGHSGVIGCEVDENRCYTSATPEDDECKTAGMWRTDDVQNDEDLRSWVAEWWPESKSLTKFSVSRHDDAQPIAL